MLGLQLNIRDVRRNTSLLITTPIVLPPSTRTIAYSKQLAAANNNGSVVWARDSGTFPTGVSINSSGLISGTPTNTGTFHVVISAEDDSTSCVVRYELVIAAVPAITTEEQLPDGVEGEEYEAVQLTASGGTLPLTWDSDEIPSGMELSSDGVLSGTPDTADDYSVDVAVTDSVGAVGTKTLLLTVSIP